LESRLPYTLSFSAESRRNMDVDIPGDVAFDKDNQGAENLRQLVQDKLNIRESNSGPGRDPVPIVLGMLH
jgi:hypothetical protein